MRGGARVNSGPLPKDSAARRRRNTGPNMVELPREGYQGPIPAWPMGRTSKMVLQAWEALWRKPQAAAWVDLGYEHTVARLARLMVAAMKTDAPSAVLTEVRQLEDRLGLNPAAMQRLRWKVADAEVQEDAAVVPIAARERRVKAVD